MKAKQENLKQTKHNGEYYECSNTTCQKKNRPDILSKNKERK